jgi:hypothetical protein
MTNQKALTPLQLYKHLPQTNCGRCFLPSCLAFAAGVIAGSKKLSACPFLDSAQQNLLSESLQPRSKQEQTQAEFLNRLEKKISTVDFKRLAPVIGASYGNNQLTINSLGKDFHIDQHGQLRSECHIIPWVRAPLLSYITNETHQGITGDWITFRELQGGIDWQGLFTSRCETPLQELADAHPDLLSDLIDLFMGKKTEAFNADIALTLHPLPHIPVLICYQAPEDDLGSTLTIFFDACCAHNLHIKSIYTLCAGLVQMFTKISKLHS